MGLENEGGRAEVKHKMSRTLFRKEECLWPLKCLDLLLLSILVILLVLCLHFIAISQHPAAKIYMCHSQLKLAHC